VEFVLCESTQQGVCNAHHSMLQRTARWILDASAALESDRLPITHTLLARLLGVRRASITDCVGALQADGLIKSARNLIHVTDPNGLRSTSCECHRFIQREYRRLLGAMPSRRLDFSAEKRCPAASIQRGSRPKEVSNVFGNARWSREM
jgi:hypothetical protein